MGNPLIQLQNVSVAINDAIILEDVSLSFRKGETSVILGPSGAGKSSILKVILGLWKPDSGKVLIDGVDIIPLPEDAMLPFRRRMAMVFQGNALFDSMTVGENIAYFLREHYLIDENEIHSRVEESLTIVNLEGKGRLYPEELSNGMKKRVAIARAVAFHPEVILYDEPTTGLDPLNARTINDLILKLQRQGTTSVIVTHLLKDAFLVGKAFFIIESGRIVAAGSADELLSSTDPFVKEFLEDMRQVRLAS
jgi:phospholipid/cholesterol/gamma-HCH transport system ATP-binding protein